MSPKNTQRLDRIATIILSSTVLLGLVACVPGGFLSGSVLKGYILLAGSALSFVFWLIARLVEGSFRIPRSKLMAALGLFVIATTISAFFSPVPHLSFWGESFEQGTVLSIVALSLLSFLASVLFDSKKRLTIFLTGFFTAYVLVGLFQIVHLLWPAATSFGVLLTPTSSVVGSWVDLAYLSGAALVGFMLILSFLRVSDSVKILSVGGSLIALFFILLIDSGIVYVLTGAASVAVLVYSLYRPVTSGTRRFPAMALVLALVTLFMLLTQTVFGGFLARVTGARFTDVHPNVVSTLVIAKETLSERFVVGAGPNNFLTAWVVHHPEGFNMSPYWDVPFTMGSSMLGTSALLAGILGIVALVLLLGAYAYDARISFRSEQLDVEKNTVVFSFFVGSTYMLALLVFATPGIAISIIAFTVFGVAISVSILSGRMTTSTYSFVRGTKGGLFALISVVVALAAGGAMLVYATKHLVSDIYFEKGVNAAALGDYVRADARFAQAIELSDLSKYERARALLAQEYLTTVFSGSSDKLTADVKQMIQNAITTGGAAAARAVVIDPHSPQNYVALGDFMRMLAPYKIEKAFDTSEAAYKEAVRIAPVYPKTYLNLASLQYDAGNMAAAKTYAAQALALKSNYIDAYFLLARIALAGDDAASAQKYLESAVEADSTNPAALFALGHFQYGQGMYHEAVLTLRAAASRSEGSFNAWYYLALADAKTGQKTEAAKILTMLHAAFPDNKDVNTALLGLSGSTTGN